MSDQPPSTPTPSDPTLPYRSAPAFDPPLERPPLPRSGPPWYVGAVGVLLLVIVGLLIVLVVRDDGETTETSDTTASTTEVTASTTPSSTDQTDSSTTSAPSSTTEATTTSVSTTSTALTTTTIDPTPYRSAVWPWFDSSTRFDDPVDAARGFAEDYVGFDDPLIGDFQQGDSRSGEVEVQPREDGPITVVMVRQLGPDDTWWVIGAATANIEVDEPAALEIITSPLTVSGRALAFEGTVDLELRADGSPAPIVEGFVSGGGTEMGSFDDTFTFEQPDVAGGALLLTTASPENGQIWEAYVLRVAFPG